MFDYNKNCVTIKKVKYYSKADNRPASTGSIQHGHIKDLINQASMHES